MSVTNFVKKVAKATARGYSNFRNTAIQGTKGSLGDTLEYVHHASRGQYDEIDDDNFLQPAAQGMELAEPLIGDRRMQKYEEAITNANDFDDLEDAIETYGGFDTRKRSDEYDEDELVQQIEIVKHKVGASSTMIASGSYESAENEQLDTTNNINYIPNEAGLRDKVEDLVTNKTPKDVDSSGYIIP
jgi:hypothetical protein